MANVSAACKTLTSPTSSSITTRPLTKLNYLFLSPGYISLDGFLPTSEGLDRKLATIFYARFKFIVELLPLLQAAEKAGEDARVIIIGGAGKGGPVDLDNLGIKKYSKYQAAVQSMTYTSLMVEVSRY